MPKGLRIFFKYLNRYFMVPLFRLGLGSVMTNPFSGYIMVMKTIGRKSSKVHYVPVNYAIWKGNVYCISGGGDGADWYKNLVAHPQIEIIMPGGAIFGKVEPAYKGEARLRIVRQILKNAGFAGFFEGYNPITIEDEQLAIETTDFPLIEITPIGLGAGASDPHGWAWILWTVIGILIILGLIILL
jgi:deazaflavin-dependent oxidoreductase (nitroreductase family)